MPAAAQVSCTTAGTAFLVSVGGDWSIDSPWPANAQAVIDRLEASEQSGNSAFSGLVLGTGQLGSWDSSLLVFLTQLVAIAKAKQLPVTFNLPDGLQRLIRMAFAVPPRRGAERAKSRESALERIGGAAMSLWPRVCDFLNFLGDVTQGVGRLCVGRSKMRGQDFVACMYECGVLSLPIISLTSMLFGLILAFVGAVQLTQFGAQIYVAGLVGIGMLRVMGAVMVGVVMSGRIGAAYAALIGTMQVNEEVDALQVLGISPVDFLVTPRVLALTLMVPLLTVYADVMGVIGGFLVGTLMLDLSPIQYLSATQQMVPYKQILIGLIYGTVFGVVIAVAGCYQGMRCGRSAMAVGQATTRAVVFSIVGIIVMTAIITVICDVLGV